MGILDQLLGPTYDSIGKKKSNKAAPEPGAQKTKAPKAVTTQKAPAVDTMPAPVAIPTAIPQLIQMPQFAAADPISPEELKAAAEHLGLLAKDEANPYPKFDFAGLDSKLKDYSNEELPLDLRGLAGLSDTLYGTKLYPMTPNLRKDALDELGKRQELADGSRALQQVKGQAMLENYKTQLQQYLNREGIQSPLQRAQMYERLSKALGRGTGVDAINRMALGVTQKNIDSLNDAAKENRGIQERQRDKTDKMTDEFRKDPAVVAYEGTQERANNLRDTLLNPKNGTSDYVSVIAFVKGLDPHSAVMFNEAQSFYQAAPIVQRILNTTDMMMNGGRLTDSQKDVMLKVMDRMVRRMREKYEQARKGKAQEAANMGINPRNVVEPVDKRVSVPEGRFRFSPANGGDDYIIPGSQVTKFKDWAKKQGIKIIPRGREE